MYVTCTYVPCITITVHPCPLNTYVTCMQQSCMHVTRMYVRYMHVTVMYARNMHVTCTVFPVGNSFQSKVSGHYQWPFHAR